MREHEKGQVLLLVLLILVVALSVAVSIITRSVIDVKTTTQEQRSQQALEAAETGIDTTINQINPDPQSSGSISTNINYTTSVAQDGSTSTLLVDEGRAILADNPGDIWTSKYDDPADGNPYNDPDYTDPLSFTATPLTLYWGDMNNTSCTDAALEVIALTGSRNNPQIEHYAFDDPACPRQAENHLTSTGVTRGTYTLTTQSGGTTITTNFPYKISISGITSVLFVRVIPLYTKSVIGVDVSPQTLWLQGETITSTGTSGSTVRKIQVVRTNPGVPIEVFPYAIFSPNSP